MSKHQIKNRYRIKAKINSARSYSKMLVTLSDDQDNKCFYCKQGFAVKKFIPRSPTFDHKIPRIDGGAHSLENGVAACRECNSYKDRMPFYMFVEITKNYDQEKENYISFKRYLYSQPLWILYLHGDIIYNRDFDAFWQFVSKIYKNIPPILIEKKSDFHCSVAKIKIYYSTKPKHHRKGSAAQFTRLITLWQALNNPDFMDISY